MNSIKYTITINKKYNSDEVLIFTDCEQDKNNDAPVFINPKEYDIGRALEMTGIALRRHYNRELKAKFEN